MWHVLRRRASDLVQERALLETQLKALQERLPAYVRHLPKPHLARLRQRVEAVERQLRAMVAPAQTDRRRTSDPAYSDPERRMAPRRRRD